MKILNRHYVALLRLYKLRCSRSRKHQFLDLLTSAFLILVLVIVRHFSLSARTFEMGFAFVFFMSVRVSTGDIVSERSQGFKVYLHRAGVSTNIYIGYLWSVVGLKIAALTLIILTGLIITFGIDGTIPSYGQQGSETIVCFLLNSVTIVPCILFLSTLFADPKLASSLIGIVYFLIALCGIVYVTGTLQIGGLGYFVLGIFPHTNLVICLLTFYHMDSHSDVLWQMKLITCISAVTYFLLFLMLETKMFKSCWQRNRNKKRRDANGNVEEALQPNHPLLETSHDTSSAKYHQENPLLHQMHEKILEAKSLSKQYDNHFVVNRISFSLYNKQILCLLGHNGAGKTTTIQMLTGVLPSDDGSIWINNQWQTNYDIKEAGKAKIGICDQHDVLYPQITVQEHLEFMASLRHVLPDQISLTIQESIASFGLENECNKYSEQLSGGNRRKLSLAMSVIGGIRLLFLDEPTSAMDPDSRRSIWQTLRQLKSQGVSILLTTHHFEEADALADRIAILSQGELLALGQSEFLKRKFGVGYNLSLFTTSTVLLSQHLTCQKALQTILMTKIPAIKDFHLGSNDLLLRCTLPFEEQARFGDLFAALEGMPEITISLELVSLEDVFLNIANHDNRREFDNENGNAMMDSLAGQGFSSSITAAVNPARPQSSPQYSLKYQLYGLLQRRIYHLSRARTDQCLLLIPLCVTIMTTLLSSLAFSALPEKVLLFLLSVTLLFIMISVEFASFVVYEKEAQLKFLMERMGLRRLMYWSGNLIFDFLLFLGFTLVISLLYFYVCGSSSAAAADEQSEDISLPGMGLLVLCTMSTGLAIILQCYLWSFLFSQTFSVVKHLPLIHVVLLLLTLWIADQTGFGDISTIVIVGVINLFSPISQFYLAFHTLWSKWSFRIDNTALIIVPMLGYTLLQILFIWILESRKSTGSSRRSLQATSTSNMPPISLSTDLVDILPPRAHSVQSTVIDQISVSTEQARIMHSENIDPIKVMELKKTYANGFVGIQDVTFGVPKEEIFALMGPNGAGKSTIFDVVTGGIPPTAGRVHLNCTEITSSYSPQLFSSVGFCSQKDILWNLLTVREHLSVFAKLKGVSQTEYTHITDFFLDILSLRADADKICSLLSVGNKRKLNVANALLGSSYLLFLDEPSSGVDPLSRRQLWKLLQIVRQLRQASILLTTHSLSEAEFLADRVGILIQGQFATLGTQRYLKAKYSQGYKITLSLHPHSPNPATKFLQIFPQASAESDTLLGAEMDFHIPPVNFSFAYAFRELQLLKMNGDIQDFSIFNTTLEQIYLQLGKIQRLH